MPHEFPTQPQKRFLPDSLDRERVINVQQAASLYGVSVTTFRRQYWAGKIPKAIRVSDRRLGWRVRDLLDHLAKQGGEAA